MSDQTALTAELDQVAAAVRQARGEEFFFPEGLHSRDERKPGQGGPVTDMFGRFLRERQHPGCSQLHFNSPGVRYAVVVDDGTYFCEACIGSRMAEFFIEEANACSCCRYDIYEGDQLRPVTASFHVYKLFGWVCPDCFEDERREAVRQRRDDLDDDRYNGIAGGPAATRRQRHRNRERQSRRRR